jgi:hypothetical protein
MEKKGKKGKKREKKGKKGKKKSQLERVDRNYSAGRAMQSRSLSVARSKPPVAPTDPIERFG